MFGWQQLKPLIAPLLPCAPRVLDLGCGTSRCAPCRALRPWPYPIPNPNPNPDPNPNPNPNPDPNPDQAMIGLEDYISPLTPLSPPYLPYITRR